MNFYNYKKTFAGLGILLILIPSVFFAIPKKAEAIVPVIDVALIAAMEEAINQQTIEIIASDWELNGPTAIYGTAGDHLRQLRIKETGPMAAVAPGLSMDGIAYAAAQILLQAMTQSTIAWIRGGFQDGGPGFITNYGDFFLDAADQATGLFMKEFLSPEVYNTICTPFRLQLKLALSIGSRNRYTNRMSCTVGAVLKNAEDFYTSLDQGSWDDWITVTGNPQNNFGGSLLLSMGELYSARVRTQNNARTESQANAGFLSMKKCVEMTCEMWGTNYETGGEYCVSEKCIGYETTSPGKWVQTQLSDATGIDFQRLNLADELNEIIMAIVGQLISMTLREIRS